MLKSKKMLSETFVFKPHHFFMLLLSIFLLNCSETIAAEYPLFADTTPRQVMTAQSKTEEMGIFKSAARWLKVDLTNRIASADGMAKGDDLVFELFSDTPYRAIVDRVSIDVQGVVTVRARLQNSPLGYVLISTTCARSLATIQVPEMNREYKIVYDPDSRSHYLMEIDPATADKLEDSPVVIPPPPKQAEQQEIENIQKRLQPDQQSSVSTVDVMVVYTPAAKQWADSSGGGITNVVSQAMEKARLVAENSVTDFAVQLVHSAEISYTESDNSETDLDRLQENGDGYLDTVHTWRDNYGADVVVLFTKMEDTGGIGYLLSSTAGRPEYAFSITRVQQASTTYTTIHEIGHNMGLHHHKEQNVQPGPGLFSYSAGWRWTSTDSNRYCSVMTYENGKYFSDGQTHTRVAYFSSPSLTYIGATVGDAADGDNARNVREIKQVIAAYRNASNGLVASYPFNGNANDISGNANHGVNYGAAPTVDRFGKTDSAYYFDGVNDYVDVSKITSQLKGIQTGSISIWFQTDEKVRGKYLFTYHRDESYYSYIVLGNFTNYIFNESIGGTILPILSFGYLNGNDYYMDGKWHNAIFVMGTNYNALFMDGNKISVTYRHQPSILTGDSNTGNIMWTDIEGALIGKSVRTGDSGYNYKGSIDDIRIYNRALSEEEVKQLYTEQPGSILSATPDSRNVSSASGTTTFNISNTGTGTMPWTATVTSGSSWLSITSGSSGSNTGTITCAFTANTSATTRTGTIRITAAGATGSPKDVTVIQAAPTNQANQFLGVWSDGVWVWDKATNQWTSMKATSNALQIAAGKVDTDSIDDLIGVWASGLYVRQSATGQWLRLSGLLPTWIAAGDLNNDGRDDVIGTWASDGLYYRNSASGTWVKLSTPAKQLASGNIGGVRDDLAAVYTDGLWVRYSANASWQKIDSAIPTWITAGDMTGDNRADIVGSYSSGTWYRNSATAAWTKITTPAEQLAAGDIDGDGRDDLAGIWSSAVWIRYGATGQWQQITPSKPKWITTGRMTEAINAAGSLDDPMASGGEVIDLSQDGPGGIEADTADSTLPSTP